MGGGTLSESVLEVAFFFDGIQPGKFFLYICV